MNENYKKNCLKKWTYRNKAQADHYAGLFGQFSYRCGYCKRFHLTSHPR